LVKVVTEQQVQEQVLAVVVALAVQPPLQQPQELEQLVGLMAAVAVVDSPMAVLEVAVLVELFVSSGPETLAHSPQLVLAHLNLLELK
jgi:hypothetical protein